MSDKPDFVIPFHRLPERFARQLEEPPATPATPRPAATIVLLRDGAGGLEVLLLKRNRSAGFVPGAYVFPGGRVDAGEADDARVTSRLGGLDASGAAARLGLAADAVPPALAYYLAALREAFEETGLLVARRADGSAVPPAGESAEVEELREALMCDEIAFGDVLEALDARLDGAAVAYIAHWITPEAEPRRYDTRFFAACVAPDADPVVDPREMTDALWVRPAEALRRYDAGRLPMVFPTIKTLQQLARFPSAGAALETLGTADVPTILPRLVVTPTGVGLDVPDPQRPEDGA